MKKKFLTILLTFLFIAVCVVSVNASDELKYDTDISWYSENGKLKATATFDYKKFNNADVELFLVELYKDNSLLLKTYHIISWDGESFPSEGIEQAVDMNGIIETYGNGAYTFRIGVCSDTYNDFKQHWDSERLNVVAWSDMSAEFVYKLPNVKLKTPVIISFANGTFEYYIPDSDYIGSLLFQLELKVNNDGGSNFSSKFHMLDYDSYYNGFDQTEWCSGMVNEYNRITGEGGNAELTLSVYAESNDVTEALSSETAKVLYGKVSGDDGISPPMQGVVTDGWFTFEVNDGTATLVSCDTLASGSVTIPSRFNNYPVTRIGNYAFLYCEEITSVKIPDSIKSIGYNAFSWCTGLLSVKIPDSVTSMGKGCFWHCENLVELKLPRNISAVPPWTCEGCYSLKEIIIPETATYIGESAFKYCRSLTSVIIPSSVEYLINGCFCNCEGLKEVKISNGTTVLDRAVFSKCTNLKKVIIPSSVNSIGIYAFYNTPLEDVYYTGDESDWNNINIHINNTSLISATRHYGWKETVQSELITPEITKQETKDTYVFTVTTSEEFDNVKVYVVLYDEDGKFLGIKVDYFETTSKSVEINKNKDAYTSKIFLWGDKMEPATKASTVGL